MFKSITKKIEKIDRQLFHYNKLLKGLHVKADRDKCLETIAMLTQLKLELELELEKEKKEFRARILNGIACTVGTVGIVTMLFAMFLIGGDKEAEYQRNKVANHRMEQASIERNLQN